MNLHALVHMIGAPFEEHGRGLSGFDCWGAVRWGLLHGFSVYVPSYTADYTTTQEGEEIAALIGRESLGWLDVPLHEARPGDVLILRIKGQPWHCGLVLDPPYFLHADRKAGTVRDRWDSVIWAKRVVAIHRHPVLAQEPVCR